MIVPPRTSSRIARALLLAVPLGLVVGCNNPTSSDSRQKPIGLQGEMRPPNPPPATK